MKEEINKLIKKAQRSLNAAKKLYKMGDYDFSVSRAYYAMFYCAEGLLLTKEMSFSKHSAVISAFGRYFAKTGLFPTTLHFHFLNAFRDRQKGDYEVIKEITKSEADAHIHNAKEFLTLTIKYLREERH